LNDVWALLARLRRGILDARGARLVERRLRGFARVRIVFVLSTRRRFEPALPVDVAPVDCHRNWTIIKVRAHGGQEANAVND
jgi:hypothetical protein